MNPTPITTEELLALSKSADLLRQTAEKAMRFDEAERLLTEHIRSWTKLHNAMTELDGNSTPKPLVDRVLGYIGDWQREARNWEERYHKEVAKNGELLRENETLARNMPPEPPEPPQSIFDTPLGAAALNPQPIKVCKVLGQRWCRTDREDLSCPRLPLHPAKGHLVLCNVLQDLQTGALTHHPTQIEDLPLVP